MKIQSDLRRETQLTNWDYKNPEGSVRYGGGLKKIKRLCDEDVEIQALLKQVLEQREEEREKERF